MNRERNYYHYDRNKSDRANDLSVGFIWGSVFTLVVVVFAIFFVSFAFVE